MDETDGSINGLIGGLIELWICWQIDLFVD
jgi:hypothetical protein